MGGGYGGKIRHWHVKLTAGAAHAVHALHAGKLVRGQEGSVTVRSLVLGKRLDGGVQHDLIFGSQQVSFNLGTGRSLA